jgi:hypothetical protein
MKRFWVFVYDVYYPSGGLNDFSKDFDTLEEAEAHGKGDVGFRWDCWQVLDTKTGSATGEVWDWAPADSLESP